MTPMMLKNKVIHLIILCIGIILIHNSSGEKVKMENINLYYDPISVPCRAVLLTLEHLNLEFNLIYIKLLDKKTISEDFKKINPLHTIPVLEDGDFVLSDSHAIIIYLVREYGGKDNSLYPNDPKFQAQVHQRLFFDDSTLYMSFRLEYNSRIYNRTPKTDKGEEKVQEALKFLENVLKKSSWAAGDSMTVADFSLVSSISTFEVSSAIDFEKYPNIKRWFIQCKSEMKGYEDANQPGVNATVDLINALDEKFGKLAETPQIV